MRHIQIIFSLFLIYASCSFGQSHRSLVNEGNDEYRNGKYNDAEVKYRKSLEKDKNSFKGYYNLGNSLLKQKNYAEALKEYKNAIGKSLDPDDYAKLLHNAGNAFLEAKQYKEGINAYKQALKVSPNDNDTKYNLAYAQKMLQVQQQQQQQNKDKNKDQNKDQNKDKKQDQNQDKNKDQNKQNKDQQQNQDKQNQDKQKQQQQPQQNISKQQAEQILNALNNDEKNVREKMKKKFRASGKNIEKDW
jgi:Ca-activated chloride channel homolog